MNRETDRLARKIHDYIYEERHKIFDLIFREGIPEDNYVVVLSQEAKYALIMYDYSAYGLSRDEETGLQTHETMMGFPVKDHPDPGSSQHVILCSKDDWRAIEGEWKV